MTTTSLKEYLAIVIDMEKNIFLQNQAIDLLKNESNEMGKPSLNHKPIEPERDKSNSLIAFVYLAFGIGGGLLVGWGINSLNSSAFLLAIIAILFGECLALCFFSLFSTEAKKISEGEKEYQLRLKKYNIDLKEYYDKLQDDKDRLEKELVQKSVLTANLNKLLNQRTQSSSNLLQIYSKNIIYPKYRNLPMLCSIYEYLCSGRCSTLEGRDGAYNILEMEMRLDRIITSLDLILANLQAIRQNQYVLYSAVQDTSRRVRAIVDNTNQMARQIEQISVQQRLSDEELKRQISRLQKSSELNAYQSERIQKELSYMNRMNYYAGRNDGSFYNLPPT